MNLNLNGQYDASINNTNCKENAAMDTIINPGKKEADLQQRIDLSLFADELTEAVEVLTEAVEAGETITDETIDEVCEEVGLPRVALAQVYAAVVHNPISTTPKAAITIGTGGIAGGFTALCGGSITLSLLVGAGAALAAHLTQGVVAHNRS